MWNAYLAIGDSASKGVGDDVGDIQCRSWTDLVAEELSVHSPEWRYKNVAYRGATAGGVLRMQVAHIDDFAPDLVSVTVGANDARVPRWTARAFAMDFAAILGWIGDVGAQAVVATYPDISRLLNEHKHGISEPWRLYFDRARQVNEVIRTMGRRFGACIVDLESCEASRDLRYLSRDCKHPNALGYRLAADAALAALEACPVLEAEGVRSG